MATTGTSPSSAAAKKAPSKTAQKKAAAGKAAATIAAGGGPEDPLADAAGAAQYVRTRHSQKKAAAAAKKAPAKKTAAAKKTAPAKKTAAAKKAAPAGPRVTKTTTAGQHPGDSTTKVHVRLPTPKALFRDNPHRVLLVEFVACFAVLGLGTVVAPQGSQDGIPRMMIKGTGLSALFLILALVSGTGKGPARASAALGALVTATYLFTSSDAANLAKWAAGFFSLGGLSGQGPVTPPPGTVHGVGA